MFKWLPVLTASALASVTIAMAVRPAAPKAAQPDAPEKGIAEFVDAQRAVNVTQLYIQNCGNCHGEDGQGGGAGTQTLLTEELFKQDHDRHFFDAIKNGVPDAAMPEYGSTMTDEQIWALVVHIRELQARALRQRNGSPKAVDGVYSSDHHRYRIETAVDQDQELEIPWALDWLPDGRMLITNRPGSMKVAQDGKVVGEVTGLPEVRHMGQGGLMDVAVHPDYAANGWVYLSFTDPAEDNARAGMTKIVRGKLRWTGNDAAWIGQQTIFQADQKDYFTAGVHFGSRIEFDGKGHIYFTIGERGQNMPAQSLSSPVGKTYRTNEDGTIPADNPFNSASDKEKGHIAAIWTYGHRNQQGLTIDLKGNVFVTEHGPRGGDEVNLIKKGANYGWPVVAWSINYNDSPYRTPWPKDGLDVTQPVFRWLPSIGACGLSTMKGTAFPRWQGDLMAGGLAGNNVDRIRVVNGKMTEREELVHGMGRVRDVVTGPEGHLYIVLNQPDKVIRLVPAE